MNTSDFLVSLKRAIGVPTYQSRFSDNDLLAIASEEQIVTVVPFMATLKGEFFVKKIEVATTKGIPELPIPARCVGRSVRELKYQDAGNLIYDLPQVSTEDVQRFVNFGTGTPAAFYVLDDNLMILPTPSVNGVAHLWYMQPPSDLTLTTCNVVSQSINTITLDNNPFIAGDIVDMITTAGRPKNTETYTVQSSVGSMITLATANTILPCQQVSIYNTTPTIMLPSEAVHVLVYAAALRVLVSLNLQEDANRVEKDLMKRIEYAGKAMSPRVEGANKKIIQRNGLLRGRASGRRFPSVNLA